MSKHFESAKLLRILDIAQQWKDTAVFLLNDIDGWRDAVAARPSLADDPRGGWPDQRDASEMWLITSALDRYLMEVFPGQSTDPIMDVCESCQTWLIEKSAETLPPSSAMWTRADRAVILVNRLEEWCMNQLRPTARIDRNEQEEICLTGALVSELTGDLLSAAAFSEACRRSHKQEDNPLGAFKNDMNRWVAPLPRIRDRWSQHAHLITPAQIVKTTDPTRPH